MADRIGSTPVRYPFSFVVAGDTGAWPDPTADGIFRQLVSQVAGIRPAPVFFANLGDFAGPGTLDRHRDYLRLVEGLPVPNICVVGNHDLDDEGGPDAWSRVHGNELRLRLLPHALRGPRRRAGRGGRGGHLPGRRGRGPARGGLDVPRDQPRVGGRAEPGGPDAHAAAPRRPLRAASGVGLPAVRSEVPRAAPSLRCASRLLCARARVRPPRARRDPLRQVGRRRHRALLGLPRHLRGGRRTPADRGSLFHAVQITITEEGSVNGKVLQAFDPEPENARLSFGD